jgi:hypothetical protein
MTGDSPTLLPPQPWSVCDKDTTGGCEPDPKDMIIRVVTTPDEASQFVDENQCGATEETACI